MAFFLQSVTRFGVFEALVAFAVAVSIYWLTRRNGEVPPAAWAAIGIFGVFGLGVMVMKVLSFTPYHIHVNVVGADGKALDSAKVWSISGDPKKLTDGWEISVPASARPEDGKLLVWAAIDSRDLTHSRVVMLGDNHSPSVTIQIGAPKDAYVAGKILNYDGDTVAGVWLSIAGFPDQAVATQNDGRFSLPAHAAHGEDVLLMVTAGKNAESHWEKAGDQDLTIRLAGVYNQDK